MAGDGRRKQLLRKFDVFDHRRQKRKHRGSLTEPLCRLPLELIEFISASLEPPDLLSLRLACKILYGKTLNIFGSRCLHTVWTDLSRSSVRKLEELSEHAQLKHHVQRLSISGSKERPLGRGYSWNRWHGLSSGHLLAHQHCSQELGNVLNLLANCRSFEICRYTRADEDTEVTCLSDNELDSTVPYWFRDCLTPGDAMTMILNLVAEAHLPVRSFLFDVQLPNVSEGLYGNPVQRYTPDLQKAAFSAGWFNLKELTIKQKLPSSLVNWALSLIQNAPNLRSLRLGFYYNLEANVLIDRLSLVADTLPQLQEFELENASLVPPDSLINFLHHSRHSLRILSLRTVVFRGTAGVVTIFRTLRNEFSSLESLNIDRDMAGRVDTDSVTFPLLSDDMPLNVAQGARLTLSSGSCRGGPRKYYVVFSNTNMDFALTALETSSEGL